MDPTGFFSRFLYGIAYTGIAPKSFYSAPQLDVHFDGTAVDFAAAAITAVAWREREGFVTYHMVNDHWGDRCALSPKWNLGRKRTPCSLIPRTIQQPVIVRAHYCHSVCPYSAQHSKAELTSIPWQCIAGRNCVNFLRVLI